MGIGYPALALKLKPIANYFIDAFRILIIPVLFLNLMGCLAKTRRLSELGELGLKP